MKKFLKYENAVELKNELEYFINLVDNYDVHNETDWIIKNYALTNSIAGVVNLSLKHPSAHSENINKDKVLKVLNDVPKNELHRIIIRGYKNKIKRSH